MFEDNQELLNEFVIESREGLAEIESDLLAIEACGDNIDIDLVNKVFRAIHSIKGAAGFMGLSTIGELSHALENVLSMIRSGELKPSPGKTNALLEGADVLRVLIEDIEHSDECDTSHNVQMLERVANGEDVEPETAPATSSRSAQKTSDSEPSESHATSTSAYVSTECAIPVCRPEDLPFTIAPELMKKCSEGRNWLYTMEFDLLADDEFSGDIVDLSRRIGDTSEIVDVQINREALGGIDQNAPHSLPCLMLVTSVLNPTVFSRFWRLPENGLFLVSEKCGTHQFQRRESSTGIVETPTAISANESVTATVSRRPAQQQAVPQSAQHSAPVTNVASPATASPPATPARNATTSPTVTAATPSPKATTPAGDKQPKDGAAPRPAESAPRPDANIRVSVAVLDQLMNLAGELVLGRNQLLQTIASNDSRMLELVGTRLNQVTSELQETIMRTRMQPVGNVFNKFTRIVRDLSNMLNKQCNLVIEGQEVELDKTIIEAIGDPLTHLIRNSVDHGVELPEARKQKGKPETGTVYLRAYHQDGKVNIAIKDDGAGIDADKLKVKAIEKGILTEDKAASMSDAEALRLIFAPGFSTAEQISAVSGRGVGMDVVKTNFERLGGSVDIDTVLGKGTTITVRLPLTLAIVPSLIVRAGNQRLAVPQTNICELVRIRQGDETRHIERLRNSEVLRLRGRLLPLVRLTRVLDNPDVETTVDTAEPASASAAAINIIVVEAGNLRYGLVVDGLHDSEEIVVKPLGRHMSDVHILAGATVLGDGQVALILDISGVAAKVGLTTTDEAEDASANADSSDNQETITTLLFTNHPSEQFAIPMNSVSRIERILIEQLDSIGGQEVLQYRDRTLPLISVEKTITAKSREEQTRLYVVVFQAGSREVGLIAPCILDICNIPSELDTHTFQETGVLGSLVLNGNATRVIDAYDLAADQHPEWFAATTKSAVPHATKSNAPEHGATPRILLAEDSSFFRAKVKSFLEQLGTEVIGCEDGSLAWEELQTSTEPFAIVVTDIEMPNMNGFELCERIKSDDRFKHLPVIALTSLASDENVQRGRIVGVDEYLIKLDRDKLVMTVTSMLAERVTPERKRQVAVATH